MGTLTLGLRLGLFQLSLGILGVLILGLLNRLLIQDIQVLAGLERLSLVTPLLLLGLGVVSVFGVERRTTGLMPTAGPVPPRCPSAVGFAPVVVATAHHPPGWPLPRGAVPVHLQHVPQRCGA